MTREVLRCRSGSVSNCLTLAFRQATFFRAGHRRDWSSSFWRPDCARSCVAAARLPEYRRAIWCVTGACCSKRWAKMTDRSPRNLAAISLNRPATQPRNVLAETTLKLGQPATLGPVAALMPGLDDQPYCCCGG